LNVFHAVNTDSGSGLQQGFMPLPSLCIVRNVNPCGLQRQNIEPITRGNRLLQQCW